MKKQKQQQTFQQNEKNDAIHIQSYTNQQSEFKVKFLNLSEKYRAAQLREEVLSRQIQEYQKILQTFFDRLQKLLTILGLDKQYKQLYSLDETNSLEVSHSQIAEDYLNSQNHQINQPLSIKSSTNIQRRINKLKSLRAITNTALDRHQITEEDIKFTLLELKIKEIKEENVGLNSKLFQLQATCRNNSQLSLEKLKLMKQIEESLKEKQQTIVEQQQQILILQQNLDHMAQKILQLQTQHSNLSKTLLQEQKVKQKLQNQLLEKTKQPTQEQKTQEIQRKCQNIIDNLVPSGEQTFKRYLQKQNFDDFLPDYKKLNKQKMFKKSQKNSNDYKAKKSNQKYQLIFG